MFTSQFLDALGRWQRGWKRDKSARIPIAAAIEREAAMLPAKFRRPGGRLYRKRHLYMTHDQSELAPLFLSGLLDEGSVTSWSTDYEHVERLGDDASFGHPRLAAGAIFAHVPREPEVILDISSLWADESFVAAAAAYCARDGSEGEALLNFAAKQSEVIMRAPLRLDEIEALSLPGNFQSLASLMGITREHEDVLHQMLDAADIRLERPFVISRDRASAVLSKVLESIATKMSTAHKV
ncbi:hypothetical protein KZX46_22295 (plasmid) [Polymorphobacter sp. PAMC 29334]|uniref:hypothetical protein n=1 Tax=Polymorphobacter sp. PAMC 29334 TaxID=2862331 RepID=UPI001C77D2A7|nr:hypothetical protein [Polymorphobacter sp. PAMC 29334]QYE37124.1 hypothetical protein KZX46_22295 [Polymorphobacter sp. PAMC 29334]